MDSLFYGRALGKLGGLGGLGLGPPGSLGWPGGLGLGPPNDSWPNFCLMALFTHVRSSPRLFTLIEFEFVENSFARSEQGSAFAVVETSIRKVARPNFIFIIGSLGN